MNNLQGQERHVIFGTGPVGMSVMDELVAKGKRVRMINRSGKAEVPIGVEVIAGDVMDCDFTRQAVSGATVVYNALNPPYHQWSELFPTLQKSVLEATASVDAKLIVMENVYMYGNTYGKPMTVTVTTRQFIDMIFHIAGNEPKYQVVPKLLLRILGLFNRTVGELVEMSYEFEEPFVVNHDEFDRTFGNYVTPLPEAIQKTVQWFKEN